MATNTQTNNYALISNGTSPSWQSLTMSKITDFNISSPTNLQVLQYNTSSSKWINATMSGSGSLSTLTDCTITTPQTGQLLQYNGINFKMDKCNIAINWKYLIELYQCCTKYKYCN